AFVAAIAADTSRFIYFADFLLGGDTFQPTALAVDRTGAAHVFGGAGAQFPTTPGAFQSTPAVGPGAPALAKIAPDASALVYATGIAHSSNFPQVSPLPAAQGARGSNFVAQLTSDGRSLVYSTYFADAQTFIGDVAASATGIAYVTGTTFSTTYPTVRPA